MLLGTTKRDQNLDWVFESECVCFPIPGMTLLHTGGSRYNVDHSTMHLTPRKTRRANAEPRFWVMLAALAVVVGQFLLPVLQSVHEGSHGDTEALRAVAFQPASCDHGRESGDVPLHHDDRTCSVCQAMHAAREAVWLPPAHAFCVLDLSPEPAPTIDRLGSAGVRVPGLALARGPPAS